MLFVAKENMLKIFKFLFSFPFLVVGKAFAIATGVVFGGATLMFGVAASKLELQNVSTYIDYQQLHFLSPQGFFFSMIS